MTDVSHRVRLLPKEIEILTQEAFGIGKVGGEDPTATGGIVTFPAGYLISCPARGQGRAELLRLTEAVDVPAVDGDEVYLAHRAGSATFELAAAVSTPVGSLKLGDASGTPVDTFTQDPKVGGLS